MQIYSLHVGDMFTNNCNFYNFPQNEFLRIGVACSNILVSLPQVFCTTLEPPKSMQAKVLKSWEIRNLINLAL